MSGWYTRRMRWNQRCTRVAIAAVGAVALPAAVFCTTFDGLEAQDPDAGGGASGAAGSDAGPGDAATGDGDADAAPLRGYLPLDQAVRACSNVFRCPQLATSSIYSLSVPVDGMNYSNCLHWLAGPMPPSRVGFTLQHDAFACIADAKSCKEAGACLWIDLLEPNDERCADAGPDAGWVCTEDGGAVLGCSAGSVIHCTSGRFTPGTSCLPGNTGEVTCALAPDCVGATSCAGPILSYCGINGLKFSMNCAYSGYTCGFDFDDYPCAPPVQDSGYCPLMGKGRCEDGALWVCDGLFETEFDCASASLDCVEKTGESAMCMPKGAACSPFDPLANQCSGSTLTVCVGGKMLPVDCAAFGMTCKPAAQGQSAHCG